MTPTAIKLCWSLPSLSDACGLPSRAVSAGESSIKILSTTVTVALVSAALTLSGCSGFQGATFPPVTTQTPLGSLQGSVFGGHAPIVNSHLFVLEATATGSAPTGYATTVKSLLSASSIANSGTFPVTQDNTVGSLTNGLYYVTTNAAGEFRLSGDYTCDIGDPVYLYASGGTQNSTFIVAITGISDTSSSGTYTYTFTGSNQLVAGQTVQFPGTSLSGEWSTLNGSTQTILAAPTSSSFRINTITAPGAGTNTQNGSATAPGVINPAVVNLVMLGVCPSSGNFSTLNFVYMNEVSTVAMAYGMAGFAKDALHIGSSAANVVGLQNAALNAASLYNIQGAPLGDSSPGQGQIANQITPAGNGTVPQAELNTLANILATCVDSANTATSPSAACTVLFTDATDNGTNSGNKATETATAMINIAKNPGTANVLRLWNLPGSVASFSPTLMSPPRDFTVAITYNNISAPGSIAIDSLGNAFVPTNASSGYVTKLSPAGAVLATSATGGNGFNSVAIDPNSNVFVTAGNSNALYKYTSSLGTASGSPFTATQLKAPTSVAIDGNGYVYVTDGGSNASVIQKYNNSGSLNASITNSCLMGVTQISIDPSNYLWATSNIMNAGCRLSNTGGNPTFSISAQMVQPGNIAIDSFGNGWAPLQGMGYLAEVTPSGQPGLFGGDNVGGISSPTWVAIDGGNNVWVTNLGDNYTLSEFNSAGTAITGNSGYQGGYLNNPSFIAIDPSGNVWIPNKGGNTVTEFIGLATPTVTPLSALRPGVRP